MLSTLWVVTTVDLALIIHYSLFGRRRGVQAGFADPSDFKVHRFAR